MNTALVGIGDIESPLEPIEKATCLAYIETYNMKATSQKVNRSQRWVSRTVSTPLAQAYIADIVAAGYSGAIITADFIKRHYLTLLPMTMGQEDVALLSPQGEQFYAKKFDAPATVAVLKEMSKAAPDFDLASQNVKAAIQVQVNIKNMVGELDPIETEVIEHATD